MASVVYGFLLPGADWHPADIWADRKDAALEVTMVTPLQVATVAEAAVTPGHGHTLTFAYDRKIKGAKIAGGRE